MKTIGYVRVSTEDQFTNGVSLDAQREKISQYAQLYKIDVIEIVQDAGLSGKNLKRPGIESIIDLIKQRKIEGLVICKLDRLTRSVRDLSFLIDLFEKKQISLISISESLDSSSAIGRMIINMIASIAQWERETICERTRTALEFKKSNGMVYNGSCLYGFKRSGKRLVLDDYEQRVISVIMRLSREYRVAEICRRLQLAGLKPRNGKFWHHKVVRKIIADESLRKNIKSRIEASNAVLKR